MSRIYFIAVILILVSAAGYATFANGRSGTMVAGIQMTTVGSFKTTAVTEETASEAETTETPEAAAPDSSSEKKDEPKEEVIDNNTHYCMVKNPIFNEKNPVLFDSGDEEDNTSCLVCHADFFAEEITSTHLDAGCTCMSCHGDSDEHRADEYGYIRPDVIWGHGEQAAFCQQCHPEHKDPAKVEAFRKENFSQRMENGRWVNERSTCMDCHGNHAISGTKEGEFK